MSKCSFEFVLQVEVKSGQRFSLHTPGSTPWAQTPRPRHAAFSGRASQHLRSYGASGICGDLPSLSGCRRHIMGTLVNHHHHPPSPRNSKLFWHEGRCLYLSPNLLSPLLHTPPSPCIFFSLHFHFGSKPSFPRFLHSRTPIRTITATQ
jgi:hypothetical protein